MTDNEKIIIGAVLERVGLDSIDAARILLEVNEHFGDEMSRISEGIRLGARELERQEQSVPFAEAVRVAVEAKKHRRKRTLNDIKQLTNRMMRCNRGLARRCLRSLTPTECRQIIDKAFDTPRQKLKARSVLSGIFSIGRKRGWCSDNPVSSVDIPVIRESEVNILKVEEIQRLLAASKEEGGDCAAAVGLMTFAGIRPKEVERMKWEDIDFEEKLIRLHPNHTKTGGTRHVTMENVLYQWLKEAYRQKAPELNSRICPKNWTFKWSLIRRKAGFHTWQQDCLRHTYASYHAKYFKNFSLLQIEMGHSSSSLLRTRYLNMKGITRDCATTFWSNSILAPC